MPSKRKVPAGPKVVPGSKGKHAASSTRQSKAVGVTPGKPTYGILHGDGKQRGTPPAGLQSTRNTPSAQGNLASKAHRQVG